MAGSADCQRNRASGRRWRNIWRSVAWRPWPPPNARPPSGGETRELGGWWGGRSLWLGLGPQASNKARRADARLDGGTDWAARRSSLAKTRTRAWQHSCHVGQCGCHSFQLAGAARGLASCSCRQRDMRTPPPSSLLLLLNLLLLLLLLLLRSRHRKMNGERSMLATWRREMNVERPVLRSWRPEMNVERPVLRS